MDPKGVSAGLGCYSSCLIPYNALHNLSRDVEGKLGYRSLLGSVPSHLQRGAPKSLCPFQASTGWVEEECTTFHLPEKWEGVLF